MPPSDYDHDDAEWTGRPQDDPKLVARLDAGRAEFRRTHPPVNCWIDSVQVVELFLDGIVRARIEPARSQITFLDAEGRDVSARIYLHSESPYDVAEAHLGIGRVAEIRDESNEAEEPISSAPRDNEDRMALEFRSRCDEEDEIFLYLREAVRALKFQGNFEELYALAIVSLLDAIREAVLRNYAAALEHSGTAAQALEKRETVMLMGKPALASCRRAIVAIERIIAIQQKFPLGSTEGKGDG